MKTTSLIPSALIRTSLLVLGLSVSNAWACEGVSGTVQASEAVLSGIQVVPLNTFNLVRLDAQARGALSGDYAAAFGENTLEARIQSSNEDVRLSLTFKEPGTSPVTQTYPAIAWCEQEGVASKDVALRYTSDGVLILIKNSKIEQASSDIWYYLPRK